MFAGTMTLACLLLAGQAGAPDVFHMNQMKFSIPIKIDPPERRAEIKELILYDSRDQGASWGKVASCTSEKEAFPFYAQGDGVYWFAVAIVDSQGQQDPLDIRSIPPGKIQKIVVDTKRPDARFVTLERKGDEVNVVVQVSDEHLQGESVKLEYRTADSPSPTWTPVALQPTGNGQGTARIRPGSGAGLLVRVSARDIAGNVGDAQGELPPVATSLAGNFPPPLTNPLPTPNPLPLPTPAPGPLVGGVGTLPAPAPVRPPYQPPYQPQPPQPAFAPLEPVGQVRNPGPGIAQPQPQGYQGQPLAHSGGLTQVSTVSSMAQNQNSFAPAIEITNKKSVKVDFEVAKFGPSGLGNVDVWMTTDDGRTWELSKGDHKAVLPTPGEVRGTSTPLQGSVLIPLPREGVVYGITLVVKSRAGLGKAPPQPGDLPQMRVELDTTLPEAKLFSPEPDGNRRDALLMHWEATDKNLTGKPITLEWAPQRNGPWYFIGQAELPNTGKYSWQVPTDVPPSVFLRLTVRDAAGNTAIAATQEPVLVDLSIPEAQIIHHPAPSNPR